MRCKKNQGDFSCRQIRGAWFDKANGTKDQYGGKSHRKGEFCTVTERGIVWTIHWGLYGESGVKLAHIFIRLLHGKQKNTDESYNPDCFHASFPNGVSASWAALYGQSLTTRPFGQKRLIND